MSIAGRAHALIRRVAEQHCADSGGMHDEEPNTTCTGHLVLSRLWPQGSAARATALQGQSRARPSRRWCFRSTIGHAAK